MKAKSNGHQTTDQVAGKAHEAVDKAAKTAGHAEEYAREHVSNADDRIREAASHGRQHADDMLSGVNGYVRENPLMCIGIAFAAGALLSSLKRRQ